MCPVLCGNHAKAAQRRQWRENCKLSRFCCCCTHASRRFMPVSCSRDVFIRPRQLRVVLANSIFVRFETPKTKPYPKPNGRSGSLWAIVGPVLGKLTIFGDLGNRNRAKPNPNWSNANSVHPLISGTRNSARTPNLIPGKGARRRKSIALRRPSFPKCKTSKGHVELKGVVKYTVLRAGRIVPLARERSHVILVRHTYTIYMYVCCPHQTWRLINILI